MGIDQHPRGLDLAGLTDPNQVRIYGRSDHTSFPVHDHQRQMDEKPKKSGSKRGPKPGGVTKKSGKAGPKEASKQGEHP